MGKITLTPVSRMLTPGSHTSFKVHIEGTDISTVHVIPCQETAGYKMQWENGNMETPVNSSDLILTIDLPHNAKMA
ncbi:hypothetical protein FJZ31_24355 [Candidatus Poribacteria bacterium]|nr:hypothetical protein [Candidatus Poribacteria bacterium]